MLYLKRKGLRRSLINKRERIVDVVIYSELVKYDAKYDKRQVL